MTSIDSMLRAFKRGASLVACTTPNQADILEQLAERLPIEGLTGVGWDTVRGLYSITPGGSSAVGSITQGMAPEGLTDFPSAMALAEAGMPPMTVLVVANAHRLVNGPDALRSVQAIMNVRGPFGASQRYLIMLSNAWTSPPELGSDVLVVDDPLPTEGERRAIVESILEIAEEGNARINNRKEAVELATQMTRGLSKYAVEQTVSLALERDGLDPKQLKARFVQAINETAGLTFEPEPIPLDSIGGLANFKEFAGAVGRGRARPNAVVFVDEIEKALAGASGAGQDSSGTSQSILGALLTWMEDNQASGLIALGPPGSGKSMSAKALGGVLGVPTIRLDIGGLKGSLVGQSEERCRTALKTIQGLAGRTFWIATCNSEVALPPELRRRFKNGVWFFDLPSKGERELIWGLYLQRYELDPNSIRPTDEGWTGAEIRSCCENAWALNISLTEAAQWIVPVASSAAEQIRSLRQNASGRYISASYPGAYQYREVSPVAPNGKKRSFDL